MNKITRFFQHISNVMKYQQLPAEKRRLTFYSEGKNYWPYLEGLIKEILSTYDETICYVCSGDDDPGMAIEHPNFLKFKIDEGFIRNWMFENMDTEIMVMTMPDINQYQVKRSRKDVHYIYTQHSLLSFHMVYRPGAFDHYDTIFCSGPYHMKEMRAIESHYNLPEKTLFEHGYARLDSILEQAKTRPHKAQSSQPKHILLAPSWGPNGIIESGVGVGVVNELLKSGYQVTLRPHPMTNIHSKKSVDAIRSAQKGQPLFSFEGSVDGQESLHASDMMICDWSGAALDYAFGLGKPVLFIDMPRKMNNPDYEVIDIEPFEVTIREEIGDVLKLNNGAVDPGALIAAVERQPEKINIQTVNEHIFNVGNSSKVGAKYILDMLAKAS